MLKKRCRYQVPYGWTQPAAIVLVTFHPCPQKCMGGVAKADLALQSSAVIDGLPSLNKHLANIPKKSMVYQWSLPLTNSHWIQIQSKAVYESCKKRNGCSHFRCLGTWVELAVVTCEKVIQLAQERKPLLLCL